MFDLNLPNPIKPGKLSTSQIAFRKLKTGFIDIGFNEVLSYSLVPESNNDLIKISNPLLSETSCLRDNFWQEHIKICNQNIRSGHDYCWIFEVGNIFHKQSDLLQEEILNGAIYGKNKFEKWLTSSKDNNLDYFVTNNTEASHLIEKLADVDGIIVRTAEINKNIFVI